LITGASAGFGAAMTRRFVRDGHRVIAAARRADRLAALNAELGDRVLPVELDVTNPTALAALPGSLPEAWREIDVLVNNAGVALGGLTPSWETNLAEWDTMVQTNILGVIHLTRAILPGMVQRNRGTILNLGSTAGTYPYPGANVYGGCKAFLKQFTLNLRADLVGRNIRVSNLEPGLVSGSELSLIRFGGDKAKADVVYAGTTPLDAEDVAEAAAWIVGLPEHVNINRIEMMPTCQASGPLAIKRRKE